MAVSYPDANHPIRGFETESGPDQPMPITLLDIIVLAVMLLSGLLAMIRGFMREILSIAAWGAAALTTLYAYQKLLPTAKTYFNNDTVAAIAVVAGVFILTLIVVSIITVRISDMILDSRIGALDRTLGFLFGLARDYKLAEATELGCLCAASVISHVGARPERALKNIAGQSGFEI